MRIIAYTYEADYHCIDCTKKRFARGLNPALYHHGIHELQEDSEGNLVRPLFSIDEWQEFDESFLEENPTQYLACGDCHEIIDEYTVAVA